MYIASVWLITMGHNAAIAGPEDVARATLQSPKGTRVKRKDIRIVASSTLCERSGKAKFCHEATRVLDNDRATAWCEGAKGNGEGEFLEVTFAAPLALTAIELVPFYAKDFRRASSNVRPSQLAVESDAGVFLVELEDFPAQVAAENGTRAKSTRYEPCGDETCSSRDERIQQGESQTIRFGQDGAPAAPLKTRRIKLTVRKVHPNHRSHDLCISSIAFFVAE